MTKLTLLTLELKGAETHRKKAESALRKKERELSLLRDDVRVIVELARSLGLNLRGREDLSAGLAWLSAKDKLEKFEADHPEV